MKRHPNVRRQIKASTNCIPKSNYNYKSNDCLAINCILKVHIIPIKESSNVLTSSEDSFIII